MFAAQWSPPPWRVFPAKKLKETVRPSKFGLFSVPPREQAIHFGSCVPVSSQSLQGKVQWQCMQYLRGKKSVGMTPCSLQHPRSTYCIVLRSLTNHYIVQKKYCINSKVWHNCHLGGVTQFTFLLISHWKPCQMALEARKWDWALHGIRPQRPLVHVADCLWMSSLLRLQYTFCPFVTHTARPRMPRCIQSKFNVLVQVLKYCYCLD